MLCRAGVTWDIFTLCGVRVRSGWFKIYEWILYYESCEMKYHVHCVLLLALFVHVQCVRPPVWPGPRSCTWPIFELHVTLDLKYTCPEFHHSASTGSRVFVKTDRRTDGQTDIQDDRINHSCGILNKQSIHFMYISGVRRQDFFSPISNLYNLHGEI